MWVALDILAHTILVAFDASDARLDGEIPLATWCSVAPADRFCVFRRVAA